MSQLAFVVNAPNYPAAKIGAFLRAGEELAQRVARELPISDGVAASKFLSLATSDHALVVKTALDVVNPISTYNSLHRVSQAGGAAGSTAVTGAIATSVILAVFASNDTTQVVTDVTSEWVLVSHPPTAGHFNNTGGSNNTGSHVLFVFYNPPQTDVQVGQSLYLLLSPVLSRTPRARRSSRAPTLTGRRSPAVRPCPVSTRCRTRSTRSCKRRPALPAWARARVLTVRH